MAARKKAAPRAAAARPKPLPAGRVAQAEVHRQRAAAERHTGTALAHRVAALEELVQALVEAR